ncbi:MAG TPA: hypothetical protein VGP65_01475 [Candidatus Angelobacter sp.]|jgi:hypothetical protein|nr:hypothetical protein [Candidatus Angelobacter sp.]
MKRLFPLMLLFSFAAVLPVFPFGQAIAEGVTPTPADDGANQSPLAKCLPAGIKLSDVVEATMAGNANGQPMKMRQVTVEQKLNDLKAACNREDKLVDGNGRQILFYHLIGCWGNPPPDYQELLQKQREEIERLKQQNTVIEMTCNPSGARISSLKETSGLFAFAGIL